VVSNRISFPGGTIGKGKKKEPLSKRKEASNRAIFPICSHTPSGLYPIDGGKGRKKTRGGKRKEEGARRPTMA